MTDLTTTRDPSPLAALLSDPERLSAIPIETVERMWAMQREAQADQARRDFMAAFAAVQADLPPIIRDAVNDQTRSKYAKLATFHAALRPVYTKHGFSVLHSQAKEGAAEGCIGIDATVMHVSGHSMPVWCEVPIDGAGIKGNVNKTKTHALGSTLTYGIRYTDTLIFAPELIDEDRDGNAADGVDAETVTEEQAANLAALIEETGADLAKFLAYGRVEKLADWPARRYGEAVKMLERKRAQA